MNLDLFHAKIQHGEPDECWPWTGGHDRRGYGLWGVNALPHRRTYVASRLAYEIHSGQPIPDGLSVLHTCDNPPCCNPDHLWLGTALDNARDKIAKGRMRRGVQVGERNSHAKLTWDQVGQIRSRPDERGVDLALEYGVSQQVICNIRKGRTWRAA